MNRLARAALFVAVNCCVASISFAAPATLPTVVTFEASGERTAAVTDPAGLGKSTLAVDVGSSISGAHKLKSNAAKLPAGRYRVTIFARLRAEPQDDLSRLRFDWKIGNGQEPIVKLQHAWTQFDSSPDRYTPLSVQITLDRPVTPTFDLNWQQVSTSAVEKVRPIRKTEPPTAPNLATKTPKKSNSLLGDDDLLSEIEGPKKLPPVTSITYPALLVDRVTFDPLGGSQWIERVHPQFVHIYPNESNPIEVRIRNTESRPVAATAELQLIAGLDEVIHTTTQQVTLSPSAETSVQFAWPGSPREFGYEARVTLSVAGQPVHTAREYFSCSFPVWKTALQASGFLDWYIREHLLEEHVLANRDKYLNVEEAFSWQPSSWTDLNPKTDHWWSGQGDAHNTASGLKTWIDASHRQGIKMITYLWPTASGPEGIEWGRRAPELTTYSGVGLATEFFDVEDLRLKPITEANKRLWRLRSGIWNYVGVNRGMLRAMETGVGETIASAKRFGWDGARFDKPPSWSAMSAEDMHSEFAQLKVEKLMHELVPEYIEQKTGTWNEEAVSVTNARYGKRRFHDHDPHFTLSYNHGVIDPQKDHDLKFVGELCAGGGQIMDEAIRMVLGAPWKEYLKRIRSQADATRERGGFHCCVAPSGVTPVQRLYTALCLFIGGSHPYGDYGWSAPLPGKYTQFMTRYGEYCWAADLEPGTADAERFELKLPDGAQEQSIWWKEYLRKRSLPDGRSQWVVHLMSAPPSENMSPKDPGKLTPWQRKLQVGRATTTMPTVWALSAEPTTRAEKLEPRSEAGRFVVELPEHRVWTMLVWTEGK